ncbi:hypothetical protein K490DRAFT_2062, partial [Saccharata proteae CBS 121410]
MVALGQTITVVNKSGKVVSTSKHLVNVFKEAQSAYRERKAELRAVRDADYEERRVRRALENYHLDDDTKSRTSKKSRSKSKPSSKKAKHAPLERGYTDSFYANDGAHPGTSPSPLRKPVSADYESRQLARRNTDGPIAVRARREQRNKSETNVDMDLAYGELPPPLPEHRLSDELELRDKMNGLTRLLEEANCVQHSVTTMIDHLQKNPDALAAVALTLAEISNLAGRMAPTALTALKGSFPAVVALLASPQFMIAAGVGVGVTIVALGGYKIIKKIKAAKEDAPLAWGPAASSSSPPPVANANADDDILLLDELQTAELSRIEKWRRGIADAAERSIGTSVDGEFITPQAS